MVENRSKNSKTTKMVQNGRKWVKKIQNGSTMFQNGPKWSKSEKNMFQKQFSFFWGGGAWAPWGPWAPQNNLL